VIVDAAAEQPIPFFNQEGAVEQNLATGAASAALTAASSSDGGTILLGQHRPHDGTSDLASQLNQHSCVLPFVPARRRPPREDVAEGR
jgi:hypothetical protein